MRAICAWVALCLLALSAMPTHAQDVASPTMAQTVQWIGQQRFHLQRTWPEAPLVEFDPIAREPSGSYCASSRDAVVGIASDGCSRTGYGMGVEFDGCHRRYIQGDLSISPISGCTGSLTLTADETATESVELFNGPLEDDDHWYCMHAHNSSADVRLRLTINLALADFARATNIPSSGSPDQTFWIQARYDRNVIHVHSQLVASYFGRGHGQTFDVHMIGLVADSAAMAQRLATAFQHIADLCASTAGPPEPF